MSKKTVTFSVIIPCYNSVRYIRDTLKSLSNQTFKDFEVILIDDNSTDGSFEEAIDALHNYKLKGNVVKKPTTVNRGVSLTRNIGISMSKGEWIVFLDSDDLFQPEKLEVVNDFINEHKDCKAIFHNYIKILGHGRIFDELPSQKMTYEKVGTDRLVSGNLICTSTVVVKKKLIQQLGGFNSELNGVEDYFLWLRISANTPWFHINSTLSQYRVLDSSLMSGRKLSYYVNQNCKLFKQVKKTELFESKQIDVLYSTLFFANMAYYISKNKGFYSYFCGLLELLKWLKILPFFYFSYVPLKIAVLTFLVKIKRILLSK